MGFCSNCHNIYCTELLKTAYGDYLCGDCWDDYICTDAGRLEYLIGICNNDYPIEEFDADFLCDVIKSWQANCAMLSLTSQERFKIEEKARELGIL